MTGLSLTSKCSFPTKRNVFSAFVPDMQSSSLKLFPSFEQKAMLLKRQAFAVFSGELDQYHLYLPLIQERLTDNLRVGQTSIVAAQMFLFFRVLLLRISPQHLTSLWPIMVSELVSTNILYPGKQRWNFEKWLSGNNILLHVQSRGV